MRAWEGLAKQQALLPACSPHSGLLSNVARSSHSNEQRPHRRMRIIVNELQMLKQKTGIGHYTAELLRCLRAQAAGDCIDGFPGGCLRALAAGSFRANRNLAGSAVSNNTRTLALARLRSRAVGLL